MIRRMIEPRSRTRRWHGWRWIVRLTLMRLRARGFNTRSVAIVGSGTAARELAFNIRSRPWTGLNLLGFVAPDGEQSRSKLELNDGSSLTRAPPNVRSNLPSLSRIVRSRRAVANEMANFFTIVSTSTTPLSLSKPKI